MKYTVAKYKKWECLHLEEVGVENMKPEYDFDRFNCCRNKLRNVLCLCDLSYVTYVT